MSSIIPTMALNMGVTAGAIRKIDRRLGDTWITPAHTQIGSADACGVEVDADGFSSIAIGNGASTNADYAIALGYDSSAGGTSSIAIGTNAVSVADNSIVIGQGAGSSNGGTSSVTIGQGASSDGSNSITIGELSTTTYNNSITIGAGITNSTANSIQMGNSSTSHFDVNGVGIHASLLSPNITNITINNSNNIGSQTSYIANVCNNYTYDASYTPTLSYTPWSTDPIGTIRYTRENGTIYTYIKVNSGQYLKIASAFIQV